MKAAANLSLLWPELPYLDRFDAAAEAGFTTVEVLFPYDMPAPETQAALAKNNLQMILLNAPPPNYAGGPRGFAANPDTKKRFRTDIKRAFRYAQALGAHMIHVMTGKGAGQAAHETLVENLKWATKIAPEGITLMLEPLNQVAQPGYYLSDYALAAEVIEAVGADNLALQFDSFHAQMIHGDAVATFEKYQQIIRHIQIGDAPNRGAPGSGAVNFTALFLAIARSGYDRWISGEYHPGGPTEDTLDWMTQCR